MTINVRDNLIMRSLLPDDADEVFSVIDNNRAYLRKWLPWVDGTDSAEVTMKVFSSWEKALEAQTDYVFGIFYNDVYVGNIGLHDINKYKSSAMIGYWLAENAQGRGIVTDCVRKLIDFGFSELGLNRIYIHCAEGNGKSRAIPERLGFVLEGMLQDGECLYGAFYNMAVYGMVRRNWICTPPGQVNRYLYTAHLYDLDQRENLTADIPFYLDYEKLRQSEVLELGCGTGRVSLELAKAGHTITGLDLSESMLKVFGEKLEKADVGIKDRISLVHGNMADFSLSKKFGLIIAPFRVFQALTEDDDIAGCLNCVREHLTEDGLFIVNAFRPNRQLDMSWCYSETVQWERDDENTGCHVVKKHWGDKIDTDRQIIYPHFAYEVTCPDGKTERVTEDLRLKYWYYAQLRELLESNGFEIKAEYGWYDKSGIENGRELIFVCGARASN